jgi:hypothetical protein
VALVGSVAYEISVAVVSYGTDSIAITHVAGEMLLQGENPYSVVGEPLTPIFQRFQIPDTFVTQTASGNSIERLVVYPAGHVVIYAGALAAGVEDLRWVTLVFEVAALAIIWWALTPRARFLVPLALLVEPNLTIYFTSGGVTDWLWVLPLVVTAVMLHRRLWGYAGLALGIACAIKQQPWFAVPFVVIWAYMEVRKVGDRDRVRRDVGALIAGFVASFAVLNLPFLIWGPADWLGGTFSPLLDRLVPDGQGPSLLASRGFLPLPQAVFSITMVLAFGVAIFLYSRRFDRMKNMLWVLPAAVLFFSHRSLHNYFIFWIPIAGLWLDLEMGPNSQGLRGRESGALEKPNRSPRAALMIGAAVVVSGAIGLYLAIGDSIEVGSVTAELEDGMVTALDVEVTNTGAEPLEPVFGVYWGRYAVPWQTSEPTEIGPDESALVRIVPSDGGVIPPLASNAGGMLQVMPFRVRVSAGGGSAYVSSNLISPEPVDASVVNPEFRFWDSAIGTLDETPYGWRSTTLVPEGSSIQLDNSGSGHGLTAAARREDARAGGWVEAAMVQDVAEVASCYELDMSYSQEYLADPRGRPQTVTGLQVLQSEAAVWFVPSAVDEIRTVDLPEGTRIVEIPAVPLVRQQLRFDLTDIGGGSGIEPGERGTIKLFSGLHDSQSGPLELRVHSINSCTED